MLPSELAHAPHVPRSPSSKLGRGLSGGRAPPGYAPVPSNDPGEGSPGRTTSKSNELGNDESASLTREIQIHKAEQQAAVFDTYAICSAILTGFSCSASYMTISDLSEQEFLHFIITNVQQWLVRMCTAMGIYSVLVFAFCAMYARSCLARPGKLGLEIYALFMKRTGRVRVRAFYNMYSMAIIYGFSVVLSCWISFGHLKASVAGSTVVVVLIVTMLDTNYIIKVAGLIYAPDDVVQAALQESAELDAAENRKRELEAAR